MAKATRRAARYQIILTTLAVSACLISGVCSAQTAPPTVGSDAPTLAAPVDPAPQMPAVSGLPSQTLAESGATNPALEPAPAQEPAVASAPAEPAAAGIAGAWHTALGFLQSGGPSIWAIAALSVITVALILWKLWRFVLAGAWSRRKPVRAVSLWQQGQHRDALNLVAGRGSARSRLVAAAMQARLDLAEAAAREETSRVARHLLARQGTGLRALELIATIAPLLGLLGTVLGMIAAFQALQDAGNSADPALLAGGIWEALLTTAAGMAVAIPASIGLTWCESVIDGLRTDMEDLAARVFLAPLDTPAKARRGLGMAAE